MGIKDKMAEKVGQIVYGSIIGSMAVLGLVFTAKEKVLDKIKKI